MAPHSLAHLVALGRPPRRCPLRAPPSRTRWPLPTRPPSRPGSPRRPLARWFCPRI